MLDNIELTTIIPAEKKENKSKKDKKDKKGKNKGNNSLGSSEFKLSSEHTTISQIADILYERKLDIVILYKLIDGTVNNWKYVQTYKCTNKSRTIALLVLLYRTGTVFFLLVRSICFLRLFTVNWDVSTVIKVTKIKYKIC